MDRFTRCALAAACLLSLSSPLLALTYVVPPDRTLIASANAIVTGTVLGSRTINGDAGIETVTTLQIDEVIKGAIVERFMEIAEPGGSYGDLQRVIPGVPQFDNGERALLMLRSGPANRWRVAELALGHFSFRRDVAGQNLAVHAGGDIVGWDSLLNVYQERRRSADRFLAYVRAEVQSAGSGTEDYYVESRPLEPLYRATTEAKHAGAVPLIAPYTAGSYTMFPGQGTTGNRWPQFPVTYGKGLTAEPGAANGGDTAINAAMTAWSTATGASINIQFSGAANSDLGLGTPDGKNTIQFEQDLTSLGAAAFTCSAQGYSGVLGIGGFFTSGTHLGPNGETFGTIIEGDVQMNQGLANCTLLLSPGGDFNSAVTHEVGHSLGFRHADRDPNDGACNSSTMECATQAIMTAFVTQGLNGQLALWDTHGAAAVYPAAACTAPPITRQPASTTITSGQSAILTVAASGSTPLSYQWYIGNPPSTTSPTGTNSSSLTVSPTTTTTYWVLVSNSCGTVNSAAATVTVSCPAPSITTQPASSTITSGQSAMLTVAASGNTLLTYQWYIGSPPSTTSPTGTNSSSLTVSPTTTTTYWVLVSNSCGSVNSAAATVTVSACTNPTISTAPNACMGSNANTATVTTVSGATYAWSITNGTITGGAGTTTITFSPTAAGSVTLQVTVATLSCSSTPSATVTARTCAGSGDANGDGTVSVSDVFYLVNFLFAGGPAPAGGTGDANGDGAVTVGDVFYMINYLFAGGPAPK
jgi:Ig-like domain CHU_C associated/Dockerin type I domain